MIKKLKIELDIDYDSVTEVFNITSTRVVQPNKTYSTVRELNQTEVKYGLISLGKNFAIQCGWSANHKLTVNYNGVDYDSKCHSQINGRIDGLAFIKSLQPQVRLKCYYNVNTNTLQINDIVY